MGRNPSVLHGAASTNLGARASGPRFRRGWYSRGYHPHFEAAYWVQSITFRLHDSVTTDLLQQWREELGLLCAQDRDDPRMLALRSRLDEYEDAGNGACHLRDPRIGMIMEQALLHFDGQRYSLIEWCVMPNHVHVLIETIRGHALSDVVHSWKSFTAKEANRILERRGKFWRADYYDRYVRDERHLATVRAYIRQNPVKAGLCERAEAWRFGSARAVARVVGGYDADAGETPADRDAGGTPGDRDAGGTPGDRDAGETPADRDW